jgi:hypothetical protein
VSETSRSLADVVLQGLHDEVFEGLPHAGAVTVVSSISRLDYRRQLAGKAPRLWQADWGLRLGLGYYWPTSLDSAHDALEGPGGVSASGDSVHLGYGLGLLWHDWALDIGFEAPNWGGLQWAQLGYEWVPWPTRVQLFAPLKLELEGAQQGANASAFSWGGVAGAGLRCWVTDGLALELLAQWHQAALQGAFLDGQGKGVYDAGGRQAQLATTGYDLRASVLWAGF